MVRQNTNLRRAGSIWLLAAILFVGVWVPLTAFASDCSRSSEGLIPLTDLGTGTYRGYEGGLYPDGSNVPPDAYLQLGLAAAADVVPRLPDGTPSSEGVIGLVAIGVSNTAIEFQAFERVLSGVPDVNPSLIVVNGAQGSRALDQWAESPDSNPWRNLDLDVLRSGLAPDQVQVVWIKLPDKSRGTIDLQADAPLEIERLNRVVEYTKARYPNLQLVYLSSRIYAGYSEGSSAEPKAYHNGFTIKWLIEEHIGVASEWVPWVGWGPYLWADGTTVRSDGLFYDCADLDDDGIHPGTGAADKVASLLLTHFSTDPTAQPWFLGRDRSLTSSSTPSTSVTSPLRTSTTLLRVAPTSPSVRPSSTRTPERNIGGSESGTSDLPAAPAQILLVAIGGFLVGFLAYLAMTARRSE